MAIMEKAHTKLSKPKSHFTAELKGPGPLQSKIYHGEKCQDQQGLTG